MPLPQDISPINPEMLDTLASAKDAEWIPTDRDGLSFMRILWTGEETGRWAALFRWGKGYVAAPHKHLSAAHVYVLSGRLKVRDGIIEAGDYLYERNGMVHGETTALEDTEYLFICDGPVLSYDEDSFTGYMGWEQLRQLQQAHAKSKVA